MFAIFATLKVKPEERDLFLRGIKDDAICSVRDEEGCLRFNVYQDNSDENTYHLFEVYRDEAAFQAHRESPHFKRFGATVEQWSAAPLDVKTATSVYPRGEEYYTQRVPKE